MAGWSHEKHLGSFIKFNDYIFYRGSIIQHAENSKPQKPTLVVICSWIFATPAQVARYIRLYEQKWPDSSILLVRSLAGDFAWVSNSVQFARLEPAVATIVEFLGSLSQPALETKQYRVIVHSFSNGGAHAAVQISEVFLKSQRYTMPVSALILDSCPSLPLSFVPTAAIIHNFDKNIVTKLAGVGLVYAVVGAVAVVDSLKLFDDALTKTRRELNNPSGAFCPLTVPRVYLYSKSDLMIPWQDVLMHVEEAKQMSMHGSPPTLDHRFADMVSVVEFYGSPHVGHMIVAKDKYWEAIQRVLSTDSSLAQSKMAKL